MRPGKSSTTATVATFWRALAELGATSIPFSDPHARAMLPDGVTRRLVGHLERRMRAPGSRTAEQFARWVDLVVLRAVVIDELLAQASAGQVVNLGAGYDTRAWRLDALANRVVLEVDHPDTQLVKRQRAERLGPLRAQRLVWVPVDLARYDLALALQGAGHLASEPTFWLCEAVVPYLDDQTLRRLLGAMRRCSAPGSRAVIHYHEPTGRSPGELRLRLMKWFGEPQIGLRTRATMAEELGAAGFRVEEDLGSAEQAARIGAREPANPLVRRSRIVVAAPA